MPHPTKKPTPAGVTPGPGFGNPPAAPKKPKPPINNSRRDVTPGPAYVKPPKKK